jgi:lysophospholipase L1-like esterase
MRTDFGRKRIEQELADLNPEFCLVLYGTNNSRDAKAIPPAMEDLLAIAASCEKRGTVPVIGTIPPRGFNDPKSEPEARYNEALIKACRDAKVPIAYIFEEFLKFEQKGSRRTLLADDGVHYIGGGWEATARAWAAAVSQVRFALLDRPE